MQGRAPFYRRNVFGVDGASCPLCFLSSRVASAFVIDLYVGLPPLAQRTSWDLTGQAHEPFSRGESTNHPDTWPTANRICRRADDPLRLESPCFTDSRGLALCLGRIVNPPQVLLPGSSVITFYGDTSCLPPYKMKFEKQVPDRHGPARVGFDRPVAISPFIA